MKYTLCLFLCCLFLANVYAKYENIWIKDEDVEAYVKNKSAVPPGVTLMPSAMPNIGTKEKALEMAQAEKEMLNKQALDAEAKLNADMARDPSDFDNYGAINGIKPTKDSIVEMDQDILGRIKQSLEDNLEKENALSALPDGAKVDLNILFPVA